MELSHTNRLVSYTVIDGNYVLVEVDLGFHVSTVAELELATSFVPEHGPLSTKAVVELWLARNMPLGLIVESVSLESYGHITGDIFILGTNRSLSSWLVKKRLAIHCAYYAEIEGKK